MRLQDHSIYHKCSSQDFKIRSKFSKIHNFLGTVCVISHDPALAHSCFKTTVYPFFPFPSMFSIKRFRV